MTVITPTALAADGKSVAVVRARVTDAFGNPIAGQSVHFSTSLGSINGSAQTDSAGVAVAPLTAPATAGVAQVMVSVGALQATSNVTFAETGRRLYLPAVRR
jgi:adhesin/invasin